MIQRSRVFLVCLAALSGLPVAAYAAPALTGASAIAKTALPADAVARGKKYDREDRWQMCLLVKPEGGQARYVAIGSWSGEFKGQRQLWQTVSVGDGVNAPAAYFVRDPYYGTRVLDGNGNFGPRMTETDFIKRALGIDATVEIIRQVMVGDARHMDGVQLSAGHLGVVQWGQSSATYEKWGATLPVDVQIHNPGGGAHLTVAGFVSRTRQQGDITWPNLPEWLPGRQPGKMTNGVHAPACNASAHF